MRSRNVRLVFGLAAALVLSMVVASSALAAPEWYFEKGKVWKKATTPVQVEVENIKLSVTEISGKTFLGVSCTTKTSVKGQGTVSSASKGEISNFELSECKGLTEAERGEEGHYDCTKFKQAKTINLPWSTELFFQAPGSVGLKIGPHSGGGEAELFAECEFLFSPIHLTCGVAATGHGVIVSSSEGVSERVNFEPKATKRTFCGGSLSGGAESGEWLGQILLKPTQKEKEAGVEGIEAH
jgi:hypothetical protein